MNHRDICHAFFYADVGESKNGSRIFYENDVIYSYGYHFPMCQKIRDKNGNVIAYLMTTRGYSVSTSTHLSYVNQAKPGYPVTFDVPNAEIKGPFKKWSKNKHKENLKALLNSANEHIISANNRRLERLKDSDLGTAKGILRTYSQYAEFFKVKLRLTKAEKLMFEAIDNPDIAKQISEAKLAQDKRIIAREKRQNKEKFKEWVNFINDYAPRKYGGYDHLRFDGSKVETTQGIHIGCAEAKILFNLILAEKLKAGMKWDGYNILRVTKTELEIGCHVFEIKECIKIGKLLNC